MTDNYMESEEKRVSAQLDQVVQLQAHIDELELRKKEAIDDILTPEIRAAVQEVNDNYAEAISTLQESIRLLKQDIEGAVLVRGASVKGQFLQAIYNKGKTTWDSKGLQGFSVAHPEILVFRKIGEPSVSFRNG